MTVEARHLNLFPPQILSNRDMMLNGTEGMNNFYSGGMMYSPMAGTTSEAAEMVFRMYGTDGLVKNGTMRAESGLTYAHLPVVSRKRCREDSNNSINMNQLVSHQNMNICDGNNRSSAAAPFTFLGEDFSSQIQRQQLEVGCLIAHHTEKVRLEMEEKRKSYSRRIMALVEEGMTKKLKAKEDEISKMVKLNWALEERVKSLCMENQIWRDLAQTNEATANVLRSNLESVLAQVEDDHHHQQRLQNVVGAAEMVDDAQSCCGSNENEDNNVVESSFRVDHDGVRLCRSCGKDEACVLLLPCRHLCLCSACGSSQHVCPLCKSTKNCSLHVNLSSS